jgi:hypothetical protein
MLWYVYFRNHCKIGCVSFIVLSPETISKDYIIENASISVFQTDDVEPIYSCSIHAIANSCLNLPKSVPVRICHKDSPIFVFNLYWTLMGFFVHWCHMYFINEQFRNTVQILIIIPTILILYFILNRMLTNDRWRTCKKHYKLVYLSFEESHKILFSSR